MANEIFRTVFWGVKTQAVHSELNNLTTAHAEKIQLMQDQIAEQIRIRDDLKKEIDTLEKLLILPELSPRYLEIAASKINRMETFLKTATEKDKQNITLEYQSRNLANEQKQQQIEDSIRQCREQFQSMMSNLNHLVENPQKNVIKNRRPNLMIVEPIREEQSLESLRFQYACGKLAGKDLLLMDGTCLIHQGETITLEIAKIAQYNEKLAELVQYMQPAEYKESM